MQNTLINEEYVIDKEQGSNDTNKNQHEFIGAIKTNNNWYPKAEIEKKKKNWPSGSHLVLKCITPGTGVELIALGYKYNTRKVLCFIMTKDAGATANGTNPYIAKFGDGHGNVNQRQVNRSDVLSLVLGSADRIDSHNHMRQFLLGHTYSLSDRLFGRGDGRRCEIFGAIRRNTGGGPGRGGVG